MFAKLTCISQHVTNLVAQKGTLKAFMIYKSLPNAFIGWVNPLHFFFTEAYF